ncbi:MAG TPA: tRNA preQ1(34) S-adenosylmethionine ribosyltransferase-isomerase QueA [Blastocatellia bacterium]|nr:tRNA preQ1(34) S-adenosylmethionine ribosyltransferase-isomerase QueA [Blastocatellia bacterium]
MLVSDFDYELPQHLIAQEPVPRRDQSRLMVVERSRQSFEDTTFEHLPTFLRRGDLVVLNNTRVFPARLIGRVLRGTHGGETVPGARVEVFLIRQVSPLLWETLVRPGRALLKGSRVEFGRGKMRAEIVEWREEGRRVVRFEPDGDFDEIVDRIGRMPLPPYIKRGEEDRLDAERYQTVFARERGAVAAPTAGLHFTPELLDAIKARGVEVAELTLHVGYGTFQPIRTKHVEDHRLDPEQYSIPEESSVRINRALAESRRIIAVGTTSTRALESAYRQTDSKVARLAGAAPVNSVRPPVPSVRKAATDLFIYPGFEFRVVSGLITNFHLPQSSLLILVAAFAGRNLILNAYRHAIDKGYRFYSYGDAMMII